MSIMIVEYWQQTLLSFRSDVSSNFEIDIEVYGLVSVLHYDL